MMLIIKTIIQLIPFIKESMGKGQHGRHRRIVILFLLALVVMSGTMIVMGQSTVKIYRNEAECLLFLNEAEDRSDLLDKKILQLEKTLNELTHIRQKQDVEIAIWKEAAQRNRSKEKPSE